MHTPATFMLTGVELSPLLREMAPDAAAAAIARQHEVVEAATRTHGAVRSERTGADGLLVVFRSVATAVGAALAVQRALAAERWPDGVPVRVRIGLDRGEVQRAVRLRDVAHGGQTLLSSAIASVVSGGLPEGARLVDHGVHRLRDLWRPEHVFELRPGEPAAEFPPLRSLDVLPNNLPAQLTSFVGRDGELAAVERLLDAQRMVTLAGSGGCGKTRLAVQVAAEVADRWPDGVWWVDLGPVMTPGLVAELAASTMRVLVDPIGGPLRALVSHLNRRHLLVCLDNCEHLIDAAAELAETLLRSCPGVSVLATSREPLGVAGETVWRVPSLPEDDAARLFADRAALVRPGFTGDDAVRVVCRRLDGIPLAVELAAAWVRVLTPVQIAAGLDDWFRLLEGGPRGAVARHRTLAASIEWSHDLLDEADRAMFRRLAVFAGGFTLDAARAVCAGTGDVLGSLGRLVDKSMVLALDGVRYRLLDTIRQYAGDRLREAGETAAIRDRHLDHFLAVAERTEPELDRDQDRWRQALRADHDNLRAALRWGLAADDPTRGRRLAAALTRLWFLHGQTHEGLDFLGQAVDRAPDDRTPLQASLLSGMALIALGSGRPVVTAATAQRGVAIAVANDDSRNHARCLACSAYGDYYRDFMASRELSLRAQRYAQEAGDVFAADFGLLLEACTYTIADRHDEAVTRARTLIERCVPRGERFCAALARDCEAFAAVFGGDVRRADVLATEAVRIAEPLGDYFTVGHTISILAWIKCIAGDIDAGRRLVDPLIRSMDSAGPEVQVPLLALSQARLHLAGGDLGGAEEWSARAARFAVPTTDNVLVARALPGLAGALRRLGRPAEARPHAERGIALARQLDVPHALADSLEEAAFLTAADDPARAEDLHQQALAVRVEHGLRTFLVDSLEALAGLATFERAVRLLAACDAARDLIGYPRPAIVQPEHGTTLEAARSGLGERAFADAWSQGATLSLDEAVAYATRSRGSRQRPSRGWASLTRTELDVVDLVVEGLTNPQIGARLFMSRATVKTHLSHVYAKLDIANRTELVALAVARSPRPPR